jgi:hypothetical protein
MPNTYTFTAPIGIPNIRTAKVVVAHVDEDAQEITAEIMLRGLGGVIYSTAGGSDTWQVVVRNGTSQGIAVDANPTKINGVIKIVSVATASGYTTAIAAYRTSRDSFLTALGTLGLMPGAGAVT